MTVQLSRYFEILLIACTIIFSYYASFQLKSSCDEELRRVMRLRAVSVDMEPDVQDNCLDDLALLCPLKTGRGEETACLQDNLDKYLNPILFLPEL
jgi:Cysteine rich repeat